jgi:hypothetical protein
LGKAFSVAKTTGLIGAAETAGLAVATLSCANTETGGKLMESIATAVKSDTVLRMTHPSVCFVQTNPPQPLGQLKAQMRATQSWRQDFDQRRF